MAFNNWELCDLGREVYRSNFAELLLLFKRENEKYTSKCVEYADFDKKLSDEGKGKILEECKLLKEGIDGIALEIAERLTDVNKYQHEVKSK